MVRSSKAGRGQGDTVMTKPVPTPFMATIVLSALLLAGGGLELAWASAPLKSPFSIEPKTVVGDKHLKRCDPAPDPIRTLATESRYDTSDKSRSKIDDQREVAYGQAIQPLRDYEKKVTHWTDQFVDN